MFRMSTVPMIDSEANAVLAFRAVSQRLIARPRRLTVLGWP
jgi:hypothetical protein